MKNHPLRRCLPAFFLAHLSLSSPAVPPISTADSYSTPKDNALVVSAAAGVLANDNANGNPQIEAVPVGLPAHGGLQLNADGSFTFTPAAGYNGTDSFTYKARKVVQPRTFTIIPAQSSATISVKIYALGTNQTKSSVSRLGGTVTAGTLDPHTTGPFSLIQVTGVNATLLDAIALHYSLLFGLFTADITAQPNAITVTMPAAGAAAVVNGAGIFSQTGNTLQANGTIHVKYSGTDADMPLDNVTGAADFNNATILSDGTTLTLTAPIDFVKNGVVVSTSPAVTADIHVTGTMKATAPAISNVAEESAVTTVSLAVTYLRATSISRVGSDYALGFADTVSGQSYQLESSLNLATWTALGSAVTATGPTLTLMTPIGVDPTRFFRLHAL